jgi:hypothetical protein
MRLKIQGGTAEHGGPPLCHTCRYATLIKGTRLRDEIVECGRLSERGRIRFAVTSCSGYSDKRQTSLRDMEEIAWVLRSDARRKQIGFVPARQLKPRDRYVLEDWD